MTHERRAELRKLRDAATQGPWADDDGNVFSVPLSEAREAAIIRIIEGSSEPHPDGAGPYDTTGWVCSTEQRTPRYDADAALIVAAVNALVPLLDALDEAEKRHGLNCGVREDIHARAVMQRDDALQRSRTAAKTLIAAIGAKGPENVDSAAGRAAAEIGQLRKRVAELEGFGAKVNAIRNSIIGMQGFNFSEHAYPLVAALDAAGFVGLGYPEARANLGTLVARVRELEGALRPHLLAHPIRCSCAGCKALKGGK